MSSLALVAPCEARAMRSAPSVMLAVLLVGCGAAQATSESEASDEVATITDPSEREAPGEAQDEATAVAEDAPPPAPAPQTPVTAVLDDWAELEPTLHAVYHGTFSVRTTRAGLNELCLAPDALLFGAGPVPAQVCTPIGDTLAYSASYPPMPTSGAGVAATTLERRREIILGAVEDGSCAGDCRATFREALWPQIHCGDLARHFERMQAEDTSCSRDEECVTLSSMCFDGAVRADRAAPHRLVLDTYGVCLDPAAGACPRVPVRAACRSGHCQALR